MSPVAVTSEKLPRTVIMPKCFAENSTCVCSGSNVQVAIDRLLPDSVRTGNLPSRAYFLQVPAVIRERRYTGRRDTEAGGARARMLSDRLNELARAGLVDRTVLDGPPLGVVYRLTESGRAIGPGLLTLGEWAERYMAPPAKRRTKA